MFVVTRLKGKSCSLCRCRNAPCALRYRSRVATIEDSEARKKNIRIDTQTHRHTDTQTDTQKKINCARTRMQSTALKQTSYICTIHTHIIYTHEIIHTSELWNQSRKSAAWSKLPIWNLQQMSKSCTHVTTQTFVLRICKYTMSTWISTPKLFCTCEVQIIYKTQKISLT